MTSRELMAPLYHQIFVDLRQGIIEGRFAEGSFLPSEFELARSYGVSRITAKRALDELASAKLAVREQGRGTVVRNTMRKRSIHASLGGLVEELRSAETSHRIRVISADDVAATPDLARIFDIPEGEPIRCIKRVLVGAAGPTSYLVSYVRPEIGKFWSKTALTKKPLTTLMENAGVTLANARERIRAIGATGEIAEYLELKKGAPVLSVVRTLSDGKQRCIEHVEAFHRSDRFDYGVNLGAG